MSDEKYPTSVSLSLDTRKKLKAYGKPRGWSTSRIIEYIVTEWLKYQDIRDQKDKK